MRWETIQKRMSSLPSLAWNRRLKGRSASRNTIAPVARDHAGDSPTAHTRTTESPRLTTNKPTEDTRGRYWIRVNAYAAMEPIIAASAVEALHTSSAAYAAHFNAGDSSFGRRGSNQCAIIGCSPAPAAR